MKRNYFIGLSFCVKLSFLVLIFLCCTSFQQVVPHEVLVQNKLKEKIDRYKADQLRLCRRKMLKKANEKVDSMLIAQAKLQTIDTIAKPPLPIKPVKPVIKQATDVGDIKPVLEQ